MKQAVDEIEQAYLQAYGGDERDALRRALGDALIEISAVSQQVSRGFVRAGKPADLARKLGPERRARQGQDIAARSAS